MRKYLLLATTAMLFAGNAMAYDIAENGQSAILNVKVNVHGSCMITEAEDFNFGNVWLTPDASDARLSMTTDGTITKAANPEYIAKFDATGTAGSFKIECPDGLSATWQAGCVEGYGPSGNCYLSLEKQSAGQLFLDNKSGTTSEGADETISIPSTLALNKGAIGKNFDTPAVKVIISY